MNDKKIRKQALLLFSFIAATIFCLASRMNFKYIAAGIAHGNFAINSGDVIFSQKSGFYDDEFYLSIYAPTEEIYYTLDGSEPTKESLKYEEPILIRDASHNENTYSMRTDVTAGFLTEEIAENGGNVFGYQAPAYKIDKCTVLKVVYFDKQGNASKVEERLFFVGFDEKPGYDDVNIISITTNPDNLFDDETGIYVLGNEFQEFYDDGTLDDEDYSNYVHWEWWDANYHEGGQEWERENYIQIFDESKNLVLSQNVGIRIQGGGSRGFLPKSLNIYARDEYGANKLYYDFWGTGYYPKRVTLTSGGDDYNSKMKDRLVAELAEEYDFATMHYEPYVLFLNGEYWGFYYLVEKYDEQYIENYYGVNKDEVIIIKNNSLEKGTEADKELYEQMKDFIESADMSDETNFQYACELLDMQSFIDYFAVEVYIGRRGDWPSDNFALWRSRNVSDKAYEDGKWRWMLFDVNSAGLSNSSIEHDTIAYVRKHSEMFNNLCNNENFVSAFCDRLLEISETIFEKEYVNEVISEYETLMTEPIRNHHKRFFGDDSGVRFQDYVGRIRNFSNQRKEFIEKYIEINFGDSYEINH